MGGVALVSISSMDNPDEKGAIGNHGDGYLAVPLLCLVVLYCLCDIVILFMILSSPSEAFFSNTANEIHLLLAAFSLK